MLVCLTQIIKMKVLNIQQVRKADAYTIQHEPIASIDLMERASLKVFQKTVELFDVNTSITILCGMGNNGGDGLVVARMLLEKKYNCKVYVVKHTTSFSEDCQINYTRLQKKFPHAVSEISKEEEIPVFNQDVIVEAILGSGLNKVVDNRLLCKLFKVINQSKSFVFSIDIPSGLWADNPTPEEACKVYADFVYTFQFPKLSFFFPENYTYVGEWEVGDIKLHPDFINKLQTPYYYVKESDILPLIKHRAKFSHKGNFGHALIVAGSKGMMGAAVLATKACLRSGAGLVEVHVPECGYSILQTTTPEALCSCDTHTDFFTHYPLEKNNSVNAIAVGPGLGVSKDSQNGLKNLIYNTKQPMVLDADAINILAENKTYVNYLPQNSILTPHLKEFERLVGKSANWFERLQKQREISQKYHIIIVLKGAHSSISLPDGNVFFNSTGNPGMATGGSGDVLTGIIVGLLAQGYPPHEAAIVGTYIHGRAGDLALQSKTCQSLIASDIIEKLWKI